MFVIAALEDALHDAAAVRVAAQLDDAFDYDLQDEPELGARDLLSWAASVGLGTAG